MNHPRAGQTKNAQNLDWHGLTTGVGVARSTTHRYLQELSDRNLIDYGRGILSAPQSAKMKTAYVSAPLVGSIRCGNPEDEEESIEEYNEYA